MEAYDFKRERALDERDTKLLQDKIDLRDSRKIFPQVGDFVIFPCGTRTRIAYEWGPDIVQLDDRAGGSYYLGDGYASWSGAGGPTIKTAELEHTGTEDGNFWFFSHEYATAGGGVYVQAPCNVYKIDRPWKSFGRCHD